MTIQGYSPDELVDLYMVARNVAWRYRLDLYEEEVLRGVMKTLTKAETEVKAQLERYFVSQTADERGQALLAEFDRLTEGIRNTLAENIVDASSEAGHYATLEHNDILSFGAKVTPFNTVALSPEQFRAFFATVPLGGKLLTEWVDSAFEATVRAGMLEELQAGVLQGEGYPKLVQRLTSDFDLTKREAINITRTFVQTANVQAQESVYAANADIVPKVRWTATLENGYKSTGRGTCIRCAVLDQKTFPREGPKPPMPLHPRCLTPETPVYAPDKIAAFVTAYSGPVIEIGLSDGARFSVTPQHVFFTPNGFISAKDLSEGANVFCSADRERVISDNPDDNGKPTPINEVVKAMAEAPGMTTVRVPLAPEHLHGDTGFVDGYVDVIAPDSLLRGDIKTFVAEHGSEFGLVWSDVTQSALIGDCPGDDYMRWLRLATDGGMSGESVSEVFLRRAGGHHQPIGVSLPTGGNSSGLKPGANDVTRNAVSLGNRVFGLPTGVGAGDFINRQFDAELTVGGHPAHGLNAISLEDAGDAGDANAVVLSEFARRFSGQVATAHVTFYRETHFSGHVYDLQTFSSLYHVDGALSSNCRCVWLPVTISWKELGIDLPELENITRPYTKRPDKNIDTGGKRTIIEVGQQQGSYGDWFKDQSKKFKTDAVGPERYDLLKSGKVKWDDFVTDEGRVRTLKELKAIKK